MFDKLFRGSIAINEVSALPLQKLLAAVCPKPVEGVGDWGELAGGMQFFQQVPHRVLFFLVFIGLEKRAVGREVANVTVARVANGAEAEDCFVATIARAEHVLVRRCSMVAEKDFA